MLRSKSVIIVMALLFTAGCLTALRLNKTMVQTSCKDERLYMDGGYYANIEFNRLKSEKSVILFQRLHGKKNKLGSFKVFSSEEGLRGDQIRLKLVKRDPATSIGDLEARIGKEKISAKLICTQKS